jgi:hypothetical protein
MAVKHKNLYLYLTLACFMGIILIFIFDGYMGLYDTLIMDNGQYQQKVEADQWSQPERYGYLASAGVERGGIIDFTYTVENHRFSEYTADVSITLWHNKAKIGDIGFIPDKPTIIPAFDKAELKWSLDTSNIFPEDYPAEQGYNLNMVIRRGEIERKINININPSPYPVKTPLTPPQ